MKYLTLTTATVALASALTLAPLQAQADTLKFLDVNTKGTTNTFIDVETLYSSVFTNRGVYSTLVNLGDNNTLSNGDTFTESFTLTSSGSIPVSFNLGGDYDIKVNLTGSIQNVGGLGPLTIGLGGVSNLGAVFDVAFTTGTISLWDRINNLWISDLTLTGGGASSIQLVRGVPISDVSLFADIVCTTACDPYLRDSTNGSLDGTSRLAITTGSANFVNFDGSTYNPAGGSILRVNFKDNGQSSTFPMPEPGMLSLMGLGLLGLGLNRRSKKSA